LTSRLSTSAGNVGDKSGNEDNITVSFILERMDHRILHLFVVENTSLGIKGSLKKVGQIMDNE
jgi:hypothetical protein